MSAPFADSVFNPFLSANQFIAKSYRAGLKNQQKQMKSRVQGDAETIHEAHYRNLPTPANTGAPVPGYKQRGPYITPSTTGAPMPGTLKTKTSVNPVTQASVTPVPVKPKGAKPTPAGTKPKK